MSLRKDHRWKSRKTISFIVSILLIAGTTTNIFFITNNGNIALAQAQSQSKSPDTSSSTHIVENNNMTDGISHSVNQTQNESPQQPSPPKTHEYTLIAENTTLEIAPGLRVDAWTYNGTIPGPTLTATEGDRVIVHFINKTPLPHTVHLHGDHPSEQDGVFEIIGANGTLHL